MNMVSTEDDFKMNDTVGEKLNSDNMDESPPHTATLSNI